MCYNNTMYQDLPPAVFECDRVCESMTTKEACVAASEVCVVFHPLINFGS